jgi:hypothetical protein
MIMTMTLVQQAKALKARQRMAKAQQSSMRAMSTVSEAKR